MMDRTDLYHRNSLILPYSDYPTHADNIKADDSVQNFKKHLKTLLFQKEFNWIYGPWQLSNDSKALLNIIGGKGAISNINYYYYYAYTSSSTVTIASICMNLDAMIYENGSRINKKCRKELLVVNISQSYVFKNVLLSERYNRNS